MLDAHCHLDLFKNPLAAAREIERRRITTVAVTNLPSHFQQGRPHVVGLKYVHLALGFHPLLAHEHAGERELFERLLPEVSYIGEIGLDLSREGKATAGDQLTSFRRILSLLGDRPRFVSLHTRGADRIVLDTLKEFATPPAVFHWYSGPLDTLAEAARAGHYFSVNPAMVRSKSGQAIIRGIPQERFLTESDGPHVRVGERAATPKDMGIVTQAAAGLWGASPEAVQETVQENYDRLTGAVDVSH